MYQDQKETTKKDESKVGTTQVWLILTDRYIEFLTSGREPVWPDHYELVAHVQTDDLANAYVLTQDNVYVSSGVEYVEPYGGEFVGQDACGLLRRYVNVPPRSTSVGDVLVTPDGTVHRVSPYCFTPINKLH